MIRNTKISNYYLFNYLSSSVKGISGRGGSSGIIISFEKSTILSSVSFVSVFILLAPIKSSVPAHLVPGKSNFVRMILSLDNAILFKLRMTNIEITTKISIAMIG